MSQIFSIQIFFSIYHKKNDFLLFVSYTKKLSNFLSKELLFLLQFDSFFTKFLSLFILFFSLYVLWFTTHSPFIWQINLEHVKFHQFSGENDLYVVESLRGTNRFFLLHTTLKIINFGKITFKNLSSVDQLVFRCAVCSWIFLSVFLSCVHRFFLRVFFYAECRTIWCVVFSFNFMCKFSSNKFQQSSRCRSRNLALK